jgi:hypothetical protein
VFPDIDAIDVEELCHGCLAKHLNHPGEPTILALINCLKLPYIPIEVEVFPYVFEPCGMAVAAVRGGGELSSAP